MDLDALLVHDIVIAVIYSLLVLFMVQCIIYLLSGANRSKKSVKHTNIKLVFVLSLEIIV